MLCHDLRVQSKHYFDSVAWENIVEILFIVSPFLMCVLLLNTSEGLAIFIYNIIC